MIEEELEKELKVELRRREKCNGQSSPFDLRRGELFNRGPAPYFLFPGTGGRWSNVLADFLQPVPANIEPAYGHLKSQVYCFRVRLDHGNHLLIGRGCLEIDIFAFALAFAIG